jgi:hypothetical protein
MEPLEGRRMLTVVDDGGMMLPMMPQSGWAMVTAETTPTATTAAATATTLTLVRLKTTYHGISVDNANQTSTVSMHIDTFTHTGHFTASLNVYTTSAGTLTGTLTGVVRLNRHVNFTFNVTGPSSSASGTGAGKVSLSGKTLTAAIEGTAGNQPFTASFVVSRK